MSKDVHNRHCAELDSRQATLRTALSLTTDESLISDVAMQVLQLEAKLEAAQTTVQSLTQAHTSTADALRESRESHAAEVQRMAAAQDAMLAAARREAAAVESERGRELAAALRGRLADADRQRAALEQQLKVRMDCRSLP